MVKAWNASGRSVAVSPGAKLCPGPILDKVIPIEAAEGVAFVVEPERLMSRARASGQAPELLGEAQAATRAPTLPQVPTMAEAGLDGFEAVLNYGLVAPAGTPREVVEVLNQKLAAVLASDDTRTRLAADGAEPTPSSPEDYAALIARDLERWGDAVRASGAKMD